jgi:hypothetical protein
MGANVSMPCRRRRHNNKVLPLNYDDIRSSAAYMLGTGWISFRDSDGARIFHNTRNGLFASCDTGIIGQS